MVRSLVLALLVVLVATSLAGSLQGTGASATAGRPVLLGWAPAAGHDADPVALLRAADAALFGPAPGLAPPPRSSDVARALTNLLEAHGHVPTPHDEAELQRLVALPPRAQDALTDVLDALFLLHETTAAAYADPTAPDFARIAAAQAYVLEAALTLRGAGSEDAPGRNAGPIIIGPIAIDPYGQDDRYDRPFNYIIEMGGHDLYNNNAGGNGLSTQTCSSNTDIVPNVPAAAALIDVAGSDEYSAERDCGVHGGAVYGSGMLVDMDGHDIYLAGGKGVNGGGYAYGIGLLVDLAGGDTYTATGAGVTGGGYAGGVGRLLDLRGNDRYTAISGGVNGGAQGAYHCVNMCQNARFALGLLLDLGGTDHYDDHVVRGHDQTVVPKEMTGAQIDLVLFA